MIVSIKNGFKIEFKDIVYLEHTAENPAFYIGEKNIDFDMDKGEFHIENHTSYSPAEFVSLKENEILFKTFTIKTQIQDHLLTLQFNHLKTPIKCHLNALQDEQIFGLGERFNGLNLRGHTVKNWVEEHITRKQIYNKIARRLVRMKPKKWPFEDYKTYYVTPSFISSRHYFCHVETSGYGVFDFRDKHKHIIEMLSPIKSITFSPHKSLLDTSAALCQYKGIIPPLPDWSYDGIILGLQGGTDVVKDRTKQLLDAGTKISAIWAQDWCGELFTYFGKQVLWNWAVDPTLYPNLKEQIATWQSQKIQFLGYINPYLNANEQMFNLALKKDYLVLNKDNSVFLTQATSFKFGIVDLTNPNAYQWFKSIIKSNMIDLGMMGWMADFGEYLPVDCVLHNGSGEMLHNAWPDLWIKLNREVLEEQNLMQKALFFNRAGYSNNTKYTTLIWNGDQHVDYTDDFGMRSALRAMLSLSLSGVGHSHSDVGGYTTVPGIKRHKRLYLRWLEMNTFTPILRTHEGNKPGVNSQSYSDLETIQATSLFSNIHFMLKPYFKQLEKDYQSTGQPIIRPTFFHYDLVKEDCFLVGEDLYVCPVMHKRKTKQVVTFPTDGWVHLFTDELYNKGTQLIDAPIGCPPVFYKEKSSHKKLFMTITNYIGDTQ